MASKYGYCDDVFRAAFCLHVAVVVLIVVFGSVGDRENSALTQSIRAKFTDFAKMSDSDNKCCTTSNTLSSSSSFLKKVDDKYV